MWVLVWLFTFLIVARAAIEMRALFYPNKISNKMVFKQSPCYRGNGLCVYLYKPLLPAPQPLPPHSYGDNWHFWDWRHCMIFEKCTHVPFSFTQDALVHRTRQGIYYLNEDLMGMHMIMWIFLKHFRFWRYFCLYRHIPQIQLLPLGSKYKPKLETWASLKLLNTENN